MTSFTKLQPTYFTTYLEQLPQNAQVKKKFSYNPSITHSDVSFNSFSDIIRYILRPFACLRNFWTKRQVKQNQEEARQVAIAALKKEVVDRELPMRRTAA